MLNIYKKFVSIIKSGKSLVSKKVFGNAAWLISEKIITMVIGVFVMAIIARFLGTENYGVYNYALAFVTIFTAISTLGLETLTIKSIVQDTDEEGTILCTSLILRVLGGGFLTFISMLIIKLLTPSDNIIHILVMIMSLTMVFKSLEVIEYWMLAYYKSKISSLIRVVTYIFSSIMKIALVYLDGNIIHLALIFLFDALIIGIALLISYFYFRTSSSKWKFKLQYAKSILSQSWFLILSGLMVSVYMQVDKIMLGTILPNKDELGIYSAATQVANMWFFIPMAIITSFNSIIFNKKKENVLEYLKLVQILYTIIAWLGIGFAIFITIFSDFLISLIFGSDYKAAANILTISIWAGIFAMLGSARSTWLISEGLQKYSVLFIGMGALVNIILNMILIPYFGGFGAAISSLVAQVTVVLIIPYFVGKTRISSVMLINAFNIFSLIKRLK